MTVQILNIQKKIFQILEKIEILNMKENKGHAICLAHGN